MAFFTRITGAVPLLISSISFVKMLWTVRKSSVLIVSEN